MKTIIAILALAAVTGCATTEDVWFKEGASAQAFNMDNGQCRAQAYGFTGGGATIAGVNVYDGCMNGKGWVTRTEPIRR